MSSAKIIKPQSLSGFPEWLPAQRRAEQHWFDACRRVFESYGFCNIETPSVEALEILLAKGETDKEIYTLNRLQADDKDKSDARLALHYDLTVPLARYTAQHFNALSFPFKRYQMQRSWRGERPQEGRYREFYQCDVDVINVDNLPLHFDAEMPLIIWDVLVALGITDVRLHISNRKILDGFLCGLGIADIQTTIRTLDKLDKIGADGVTAQLTAQGLAPDVVARALRLSQIKTADNSFAAQVAALGVQHKTLQQGLDELSFVMNYLQDLPAGSVVADLSIARGFDYYTGTVYEGRFINYPDYGSVVAGGRYDDLASGYINKKLPGVGISLGLTRLFAKMIKEGRLPEARPVPTDVLIVLANDDMRPAAQTLARQFRQRGINAEVYHAPQKFDRQLSYADKKQIPYVWFMPLDEQTAHRVKNMASGTQVDADAARWQPIIVN